jgi:copper transport protein
VSPVLVEVALGLTRIVTYVGYVLLAGTFTFWSLVWPDGRRDRRLVRLAVIGTVLLALGTFADPAFRVALAGQPLADVLTPAIGAALLVRLAALAATAFFLVDLIRSPITGGRRVFAVLVVAVVAGSMVVQSDAAGSPREALAVVALSGHVLATAAWLGGLVALAAVLIPRDHPEGLERLVPRFSQVALFSVIILLVTGIVDALVVAGGLAALVNSPYGRGVLIKIGVLAGMVVLGQLGRRYAARLAFRRVHQPTELVKNSGAAHSLALVMGIEVVIAVGVLATTSMLVMVAPS